MSQPLPQPLPPRRFSRFMLRYGGQGVPVSLALLYFGFAVAGWLVLVVAVVAVVIGLIARWWPRPGGGWRLAGRPGDGNMDGNWITPSASWDNNAAAASTVTDRRGGFWESGGGGTDNSSGSSDSGGGGGDGGGGGGGGGGE